MIYVFFLNPNRRTWDKLQCFCFYIPFKGIPLITIHSVYLDNVTHSLILHVRLLTTNLFDNMLDYLTYFKYQSYKVCRLGLSAEYSEAVLFILLRAIFSL